MAQSLLFLPTTTVLLILSLSSSPTTADDVVLDIYRDPVEVGWDYYIRPVEAYGGGVQLHARVDAPDCPQFVGLDLRSLEYGDPIELLPVSPNATTDDINVHLSEELNIATYTDAHKKCPNDVWKVRPDRTNRVIDVVTGGTLAPDSLFKIEKAEFGDNVYVIKHCPNSPPDNEGNNAKFGEDDCGTLGSYYDNIEGKFYLHSTTVSEPLRFYFIKASGRKKLTDVASEPTTSAVQSE